MNRSYNLKKLNKIALLHTWICDKHQNPHWNLGEQFEPAHQELQEFFNKSSAVEVLKELLEHERNLQHEDEALAEDCYNGEEGDEGDMYSQYAEKRRIIVEELEIILRDLADLQ